MKQYVFTEEDALDFIINYDIKIGLGMNRMKNN